jgi:hypothetical protein
MDTSCRRGANASQPLDSTLYLVLRGEAVEAERFFERQAGS